jgi:amino acid adenylation domain-containing protein
MPPPGRLTTEQRHLLGRLMDEQRIGARVPAIAPVGAAAGRLPLSSAQRSIWFFDQLSPGSPVYNVAGTARMRGPLDREALRHSLEIIVRRHQTLRTTFHQKDGEPFASAGEPPRITLPVIDLSTRTGPDRTAAAAARCREFAHAPFDLSTDLMLRAELLRLADDEHLLALCIHHIAADGWSLGVLVDELATLYAQLRDGLAPELPELPVQYADFAAWQAGRLEDPVVRDQLRYWRDRLDGAEPVDLPLDRPRHTATTSAGGSVRFEIPAAVVDQLDALGRAERATRYMSMLAAFGCLLSRWTGQRDLTVGASAAGRGRPEIAGLIGCFVNTLPLRLDVAGHHTFRSLLRRTRTICLEAYERQDAPFEKVVEELAPDRNPAAQTPLFRHTLVLYDAPDPVVTIPGLTVEVTPLYTDTAKFELRMELTPSRSGHLTGVLEYAAELLDRRSAEQLVASFRTLLTAAAAGPDTPVARLPLLTPAERAALVDAAARSGEAAADRACLHQLIERTADRAPAAVAVHGPDQTLSYAELDEHANQFARRLLTLGAGREAPVAVCLERSATLIVTLLAVLKSGAPFVPLDPEYPAERVREMLADCGARLLVAGPGTPAGRVADAEELGLTVIRAGTAAGPAANAGDGEPAVRSRVPVSPDDLAYIIYTSGSTGKPKGVEVTHAALVNLLAGRQREHRMGPGDAALSRTPIGFDVFIGEWAWPLTTGARSVLARPGGHGDPAYLTELIAATGVTTCNVVPSLLAELLAAPAARSCTTLRRVMSGGEVLTTALARRVSQVLPAAELTNLYGPTETAIDVTAYRVSPARHHPHGRVPIGRPIPGTRLYVLDAEMEPVPAGVPGDLYAGGAQVARCYHGRPGLTAERFVPDPFASGQRLYRTGDRVRMLPDGSLDFLGRSDRQVKLRGQRLEPGEIEAVLAAHEAVDRSVVVTVPDASGQTGLAGYVTALPGAAEPDGSLAAALLAHLRRYLPESMMPASVTVLDHWPVLPNGKLDRSALPVPRVGQCLPGPGEPVSPRTETEEAVARIWQDVLDVERISVLDSFFDLGGHSLLAARIVARIRASYSVDLPLAALLREPTVASVAAYLDSRPAAGPDTAQRIPRATRTARPAPGGTGRAEDR